MEMNLVFVLAELRYPFLQKCNSWVVAGTERRGIAHFELKLSSHWKRGPTGVHFERGFPGASDALQGIYGVR